MSENEKKRSVPVSVHASFQTLEQKLLFEAVVLPEITSVLDKYASLLGYDNY